MTSMENPVGVPGITGGGITDGFRFMVDVAPLVGCHTRLPKSVSPAGITSGGDGGELCEGLSDASPSASTVLDAPSTRFRCLVWTKNSSVNATIPVVKQNASRSGWPPCELDNGKHRRTCAKEHHPNTHNSAPECGHSHTLMENMAPPSPGQPSPGLPRTSVALTTSRSGTGASAFER